jgi:hypothetical protein
MGEPTSYSQRLTVALWVSAIAGFAVAMLWFALTFLLFNARQSAATDWMGRIELLTCPPWRWGVPLLLVPFLNAAVYALAVLVVFRVMKAFTRSAG